MENDIRALIEERLILSNVELCHLFDGKSFNRDLLMRIFPMLPSKMFNDTDNSIGTMLTEAAITACQKITSAEAYKQLILANTDSERLKQIDLSLQQGEMSREQCYLVVREILPTETELHEKINPRGNRFLKNMIVSYVLNTFLHLLLKNDPLITITWGTSIRGDVCELNNLWYGKNIVMSQATFDGFEVVSGARCGMIECYTNKTNQKLIGELKSSYNASVIQQLKRKFFK
ncbi:MAG: hypothetical protein ACK5MF_06240 [Vibrio sp.]|uniref:hypothetical protein n=1 Tax=Vibrio sp. TaxID=678 RepID=UPI003A8B8E38